MRNCWFSPPGTKLSEITALQLRTKYSKERKQCRFEGCYCCLSCEGGRMGARARRTHLFAVIIAGKYLPLLHLEKGSQKRQI